MASTHTDRNITVYSLYRYDDTGEPAVAFRIETYLFQVQHDKLYDVVKQCIQGLKKKKIIRDYPVTIDLGDDIESVKASWYLCLSFDICPCIEMSVQLETYDWIWTQINCEK